MKFKTNYSQNIKLTCEEFISVNHYKGVRVIGGKKKTFPQFYILPDVVRFQNSFLRYTKEQIKKQNWITPEKGQFVIVEATFYFPRIDMDANNYWKVLLDVLTKAKLWNDDNIVMERVNRIYYDTTNPRIELNIFPFENYGVFDSSEQLNKFKQDNCSNCRKKIEKCSILKRLLDNRLSSDFDLNTKKCKKLL